MNNVMKLIMCSAIIGFSGLIFGMNKQQIVCSDSEQKLYIDCNVSKYQSINRDGTHSYSVISNPLITCKGDIEKWEDGKYCIRGKYNYGFCSQVQGQDNCLELNRWNFFIALDFTQAQLKELVKVRQQGKNVFMIDKYGYRLDIDNILCDENFFDLDEKVIIDFTEDEKKRQLKKVNRNHKTSELWFVFNATIVCSMCIVYAAVKFSGMC